MKIPKIFQKKTHYTPPHFGKINQAVYEKRHAQIEKERAREDIETRLDPNYNRKTQIYSYQNQADQIAFTLDHTGKTKKEVLAQAYRQIRDQLTLKNTNLSDCFDHNAYRNIKGNWVKPHITPHDQEQYLKRHQNILTAIIDPLETQAQQERQTLAQKQNLTQHVQNRIDQIQHQQQKREAELDQQLQTVQTQIDQVQKIITQQKEKHSPTPNKPDIDRLETMIATLQRLKNG